MSRFAATVLLMPILAGCAFFSSAGQPSDPALGNLQDWRFATGKPPTDIEYAAVVAACRDGMMLGTEGQPLDSCLADLGLRRVE
jgi:hypothetical protein